LSSEFLSYEDPSWFYYKNQLEDKKALNDWNKFPLLTYMVFQELMALDFLKLLEGIIDGPLLVDHGLHGGGWHIHASGGNLNPHLDYSIHPKMEKLRKLNIIIYLSEELTNDHGGHLGLWSGTNDNLHLEKEIQPVFNRAIIFDTTQNSWHGMSRKLVQPNNIYRKSLAIYYLTDVGENFDSRNKALFAPRDDQKGDLSVQELIKIRSDSLNFKKAYRK
jgi:Rps23 Pro-64 3,4-dihydroxylase Tpa1-like proline 4-hydroxylase